LVEVFWIVISEFWTAAIFFKYSLRLIISSLINVRMSVINFKCHLLIKQTQKESDSGDIFSQLIQSISVSDLSGKS